MSRAKKAEALAVEYRNIKDLAPYSNNARTHSDEQVAQIAASIEEFGWTNPILVDGQNGVVAGHGRLLAAKSLGMARVPVIELAALSEAQKRAYVLADNKLAENAGWDFGLVRTEFEALSDAGFDVSVIGFSPDEVDNFLAPAGTEGKTDPEETPEPPAQPVSRPGDLWLCGRHRVLCGDATVATDVERLLAEAVPHLMVTDPPYGVEYDPNWRNIAKRPNGRPDGAASLGKVQNDDRADWREAWSSFPGDVAYIWHADKGAHAVAESLIAAGFELRAQIVWGKNRTIMGRGHYHYNHEPCWYSVRSGRQAHWTGKRDQGTLWRFDHEPNTTGHGTQKPIECMRRPIVNNSARGESVYDPFLGSGTTMIAAEMEGRTCLGLEINPAYCDVIVQRWQEFTGEQATLEGSDNTFDQLAEQRLAS